MAVDLNKLIEDTKKRDAEAKATAEKAQKSASKTKSNSESLAKYRRYVDYANTLRNTRNTFEEVIKRYASRIARGDKLDALEQDELDNAIEQYNRLDGAISKAQKDAYNIYTGRTESPPPLTSRVGEQKTTTTTAGPTGTVTTTPAPAATKQPSQQPSKTPAKKTPSKKSEPKPAGGAISEGFSPAAARAGEEASMGAATPTGVPGAKRSFTDLLKETEFWYDLPDYIFKLDMDPTTGEPGEMGKILVQAINEGWNEDKFLSKIRLTKWWQANSKPIRERIISRAKYNELLSSGQDVSKTEYALDSAAIKRSVQSRARTMGANLDENAINQIVSRIYDGFLENDTVAIDSFIAPYIGKVSSIIGSGIGIQPTGYTGEALRNYQTLQAVAKANGFKVTDILPRLSVAPGQTIDDVVLQKLATGELDINRLAQDARNLAAQGQPDYVKGLLQQGYDLEQVYAPYKNVMGSVLELNPDEIDLNDMTLRSAIGQDKEMNLFDFKRALRKDSRWQYTGGAREEVANSVLGVLRDFGFQG